MKLTGYYITAICKFEDGIRDVLGLNEADEVF